MCGVRALVVFFFFKQKTAYEMRISDWSSDVCSSDLHAAARRIDTLVVADRRADHHHVIDDRRLRGCDDFASEQRLFAGRHLHFAVIAEALAELAGLGIDGDQAVVERAEEDARLADRAIGGGGVNPVRDAATLYRKSTR